METYCSWCSTSLRCRRPRSTCTWLDRTSTGTRCSLRTGTRSSHLDRILRICSWLRKSSCLGEDAGVEVPLRAKTVLYTYQWYIQAPLVATSAIFFDSSQLNCSRRGNQLAFFSASFQNFGCELPGRAVVFYTPRPLVACADRHFFRE